MARRYSGLLAVLAVAVLLPAGGAALAQARKGPARGLFERVEAAELVAEVTVLSSEESPAPPAFPGQEAVRVTARLRVEEALLGRATAGEVLEVRYVRTLRVNGVDSGLRPVYEQGRRLVAILRRAGDVLELDDPFLKPPPSRERALAAARSVEALRAFNAADRVELGPIERSPLGAAAAYAKLLEVAPPAEVLRLLERAATSPHPTARAWAARGFGDLGEPKAIPALFELASDPAEVAATGGGAAPAKTSVGAVAAASLERYPGFARRVALLIERLERPAPLDPVRLGAALAALTGGEGGADVARWQAWWLGPPGSLPGSGPAYRGLPGAHRAVREADLVALGEAAAVTLKPLPAGPLSKRVEISVSFVPRKVVSGAPGGPQVRLVFDWDVTIGGAGNDVPPPIVGWQGLEGRVASPAPRAVLLLRRAPDGSYRFLSDPEVPGGPFASMGWASPDALAFVEEVAAEVDALEALEAAGAVEPAPLDAETALGKAFALLRRAGRGGTGGFPADRRALFEHLARSPNAAARAWAVRGLLEEKDSGVVPLLFVLAADRAPVAALRPGGRTEETTVGALARSALGGVPHGRFHALRRLIVLLRSPQGLDPARIAGALRSLTGQDLGPDPAAWEAWWGWKAD